MRGPSPQPAIERLLARTVKSDDGCWLWQGALKGNGYGVIGDDAPSRRQVYVHRLMWRETHGALPAKGLEVCHKCDVRNCVNPDHLFVATHAENIRDQVEKGRNRKGVSVYWSVKLTEAQVLEIRARHATGERAATLAREYGISSSQAEFIVNRKRWTHI